MPLEIVPALVPAGGKAAGRGARQQRQGAAGAPQLALLKESDPSPPAAFL